MAMSLQSRARVLVQMLFDKIKADPFKGKGSLHHQWNMEDGSVVHAYVNTLGAWPIVRTWIESPLGHSASSDLTTQILIAIEAGWITGGFLTEALLWRDDSIRSRVSGPKDRAWLDKAINRSNTPLGWEFTARTPFSDGDLSLAFPETPSRKSYLLAWELGHPNSGDLTAISSVVTAPQTSLLEVMRQAKMGYVGRGFDGAAAITFSPASVLFTYGLYETADSVALFWLELSRYRLRYQIVKFSASAHAFWVTYRLLKAQGKTEQANFARAWALAAVVDGPVATEWSTAGSWETIPGEPVAYGWAGTREGDKWIITTQIYFTLCCTILMSKFFYSI
jgi:hypothetical protein